MARNPSQLNPDFGLHSGLMSAITQHLFGLNHLYLYLPSCAVCNLWSRVQPVTCSAARPGAAGLLVGTPYLATLQFLDQREPLIFQHWRSDNKSSSCCPCSQWSIVAWESFSLFQMCRRATPREFALLTQGRASTLFCQFGRFTAGTSQNWEMWGSVYVPAFMFSVGSTTLLALGTVNVTRRRIYRRFRARPEAKFDHRFPAAILNPSSEIVVHKDPLNTNANFSSTHSFLLM